MPLEIVRNDIAKMDVDAVVNAANNRLREGSGVCGALFAAAGREKLRAACDELGYCPTGGAVLTKGFGLPARYVIHTVGPVWQGGGAGEEALLRACYLNSLTLAREQGFSSVAFPLLSAGIFGYPLGEAMAVAVSAIGAFLLENEMTVYLVVFGRAAFDLSGKLVSSVRAYIDDRYVGSRHRDRRNEPQDICASPSISTPMEEPKALWEDACLSGRPTAAKQKKNRAFPSLDDILRRQGESFSVMLLRLIDERQLTDPEVYKRANLDRKLFSKIRTNPHYRPGKNTVLALCVALRLNIDQTADLLRRAGYALSPASRFDLIVEYFIREGRYDIFEINETLFLLEESMLGA